MKFIIALLVFALAGCNSKLGTIGESAAPETTTTTTMAAKDTAPALSWESDKAPVRKEWSQFLRAELERTFSVFDSAKDATRFCPTYAKLDHNQKVHVWAEALVWVMFYESGWKPTSWMIEKSMGIDPITKKQVRSEGLFQMSYQDTQWAKTCKFDWSKDRLLGENDPKKTIFDPKLNMQCAIDVLARQITRKGNVILSSGVYWAVLKDGGKYGKVKQITDKTKALPFCK